MRSHPDKFNFNVVNTHAALTSETILTSISEILQEFANGGRHDGRLDVPGVAGLDLGRGGAASAKSPADVKPASALIQFNSGILDSLPVQSGVKNITLIPSPSGKLPKTLL